MGLLSEHLFIGYHKVARETVSRFAHFEQSHSAMPHNIDPVSSRTRQIVTATKTLTFMRAYICHLRFHHRFSDRVLIHRRIYVFLKQNKSRKP